jgi:isopentenyldiphosphate isomerase
LWVYRIEQDGRFGLHPEEIDCGEWLEPAELTKRIAVDPENYCSAFRMIWEKAASRDAKPQRD